MDTNYICVRCLAQPRRSLPLSPPYRYLFSAVVWNIFPKRPERHWCTPNLVVRWCWKSLRRGTAARARIWSFNLHLVSRLRNSGAISPLACGQLYLLHRRFRVRVLVCWLCNVTKFVGSVGTPVTGCLVHWIKSRTKDVGVSECGSKARGQPAQFMNGGRKKKTNHYSKRGHNTILLSNNC
jgi:hypothetical protein